MAEIFPFTALLSDPAFAEAHILNGGFKKQFEKDPDTTYLNADDKPCIYVYQQEEHGDTQTGIWAQVIPNAIKIHEQLLPEKVERIHDFRLRTGLEPKPVLLTYRPVKTIKAFIADAINAMPSITYTNGHHTHRLWRVNDPSLYQAAFESLNAFYMADGHHRLAANPFETLSALLMDTDEIRVKSYNRLVQTELNLEDYFSITSVQGPVQPTFKHHFGLLRADCWYTLTARKPQQFDTEILADLFENIEYTPGIVGEPDKLLFTLCPLDIEEVLAAADSGEILPPKSTWIEPKIPYGLLLSTHFVNSPHG